MELAKPVFYVEKLSGGAYSMVSDIADAIFMGEANNVKSMTEAYLKAYPPTAKKQLLKGHNGSYIPTAELWHFLFESGYSAPMAYNLTDEVEPEKIQATFKEVADNFHKCGSPFFWEALMCLNQNTDEERQNQFETLLSNYLLTFYDVHHPLKEHLEATSFVTFPAAVAEKRVGIDQFAPRSTMVYQQSFNWLYEIIKERLSKGVFKCQYPVDLEIYVLQAMDFITFEENLYEQNSSIKAIPTGRAFPMVAQYKDLRCFHSPV